MFRNTRTQLYTARVLLAASLLSGILLLPGCTNGEEKLYLYSAASMSDVAAELVQKFTAENPQIDVRVNSAGSGTLANQILSGAPWDVYISASSIQARRVAEAEQASVEEFSPIICTNSLVLAVEATRPGIEESTPEHGLEQLLTGADMERIGMGNPGYVPAGDYAKELLSEKQLFPKIEDKIVYASSVRQALGWLEAGEVDAAFLYSTDAETGDDVEVIQSWDRPAGREIVYPVLFNGYSTSESHASESPVQVFARFLFSAYSEKELRNHGFTPNSPVFDAEGS